MGEQFAQGDVALAALELGKVVCDLIVEAEAALLEELHEGGCGRHDFGERGAIEDGVRGHGLRLRHQRALAVGLAVDHLAVVSHQQNRAGHTPLFDGLIDYLVQCGCTWKRLRGQSTGHKRGAPEKLHIYL